MWVNKQLFDMIVQDNKKQQGEIAQLSADRAAVVATMVDYRSQKVRDDISIDWMRHRVNALEKQNAILMQKAAGIHLPVPEIVPTRPGTMSEIPDFPTMPTFEDVGDIEAERLGIRQLSDGSVEYTK